MWSSGRRSLLAVNKTGVLTGETDWVRSPKLPAANDSSYERPPLFFARRANPPTTRHRARQRPTRPRRGLPSGVSIGRLSGVGALWDCVPRVCGGGGGCAGGGVPLGGCARAVLMWGGVSRRYIIIIIEPSNTIMGVLRSPPSLHRFAPFFRSPPHRPLHSRRSVCLLLLRFRLYHRYLLWRWAPQRYLLLRCRLHHRYLPWRRALQRYLRRGRSPQRYLRFRLHHWWRLRRCCQHHWTHWPEGEHLIHEGGALATR